MKQSTSQVAHPKWVGVGLLHRCQKKATMQQSYAYPPQIPVDKPGHPSALPMSALTYPPNFPGRAVERAGVLEPLVTSGDQAQAHPSLQTDAGGASEAR